LKKKIENFAEEKRTQALEIARRKKWTSGAGGEKQHNKTRTKKGAGKLPTGFAKGDCRENSHRKMLDEEEKRRLPAPRSKGGI